MKWHAQNGATVSGAQLKVGDIVALDFKAWRISDIAEVDEAFRVCAFDATEVDAHRYSMTAPARYRWTLLGEHYSVCVKCGDVQPCREQEASKTASEEARRAERFELAGVCPACLELVTSRQKSLTFQENVETILGPPVTFHLRRGCLSAAIRYDRGWAKRLGVKPKLEESLTCDGGLHHHRDGVTTCTSADCPSLRAWHGRWMECYVLSHGCPRFECEFAAVAS